MYITKVDINNIRSISHFEMTFDKPAGWHVLIGDNGAGKSSIVRAIAIALIGPDEVIAVRPNWEEWLRIGCTEGSISLTLSYEKGSDRTSQTRPTDKNISNTMRFKRNGRIELSSNINDKSLNPKNFNWGNNKGWFSVAYGPFRRFTGGNPDWNRIFSAYPKVGAHLSVFGEDVALSEALEWLRELDYQRLKEKETNNDNSADKTFERLKNFINQTGLLPHNTIFDHVNTEGPVFKDGDGKEVIVTQLSDGYRSLLSLTFELIRQLVRVYGVERVFKNDNEIDVTGVVLIDEIDAHLHPTWQTRIGQWFTKYFPNIQFIVTTHSPLVCRACENGSIWRLAAPGSEHESGEITGTTKQRLIRGNVLDAYGTEIFGAVSIGKESDEKLTRLAELNHKSMIGETSDAEEKELNELKSYLTPIL